MRGYLQLCLLGLVLASVASSCNGPGTQTLAQQAVSPDDWPQFRGPGGLGVSKAKGLPVTWSANKNLLWKVELPGAGASSPIVVGDRLFVTCYSGYGIPGQDKGALNQLKRHVLCLNASTGKTLWKTDVPASLPESPTVREHGYAASTPACDGERLYVFFGKSGVFAFDLDGRQLWRADVGTQFHGWGSAASPVLYKNLVLINACVESESLVALDKNTGREVWRARGIKESWNTPLIVTNSNGKSELVLAVMGKILSFNPDTGQLLWNCATDIKWYMVPSVTAQNGVVYSIGGRGGVAALAVRTGGKGDVSNTHRLWTSTKGSNVSSPIVMDGYLYWVHENLGVAYCAEAMTGRVLYEERLPRAGQFYASPILADDKLYYVSRYGRTFVLKAGPKFELLAVNDLSDGSNFDASPAVAGTRLYLRSNRFLYCVKNQ